MSRKLALTAATGATALGIGLFYRRSTASEDQGSSSSSSSSPPRHSASAKRNHGLEGAAVGGNAIVGTTELDAARSGPPAISSPAPREKLPSGGVGGGEGAGGSTARKTQFPMASKGTSFGGEKPRGPDVGSSNGPGMLEGLRTVLGPGEKEGVNPVDEGGFRDTRGASKMGSELSSKKKAPPA
ncbi:hypothetical protein CDD80_952 [Ophiocordyceps camponoti-rufipedis]|uniref:Uncharacterized protein n=1 Tax=Ophiocordyceps camponoti-rufipedis TaxID=2004952 RepID=A0A2C5ZB34_9HYPO|nr:hypothetical protein CDD80_952 [Ophiocordyceps camponoti-rufipedis]